MQNKQEFIDLVHQGLHKAFKTLARIPEGEANLVIRVPYRQ
jgi:hypothetical protein